MNPGNSKIDLSQPESRTRDWTGIILGSVASFFGSLLSFGMAIEAVLFFRYPGLQDPSSVPASYWPSDAFQLVGGFSVLMLLFFALALWLFCERNNRNQR